MGDVGGVVHAETDGDDDVGAGDRVDGQAPEVDEAADIDEREEDTEEDNDTGREVLDENQRCDEDTEEREAHVPPELQLDHLISFPARIFSAHGKCSVGEVCLGHNLFDLVHGRDPL